MEKKKKKETLSSFDSLYHGVIVRLFEGIQDGRAGNIQYPVLDALKSGFAIYSLKVASLFSFRKKSKAEDSNLHSVYGIEKIPTDNTLRNILDGINPAKVREGFHELFKRIKKLGIWQEYRYWRQHVVVSVDGVEHFCSTSIHCEHCMQRKHRDGSTSYYHAMLSAAILHPQKKEVFMLDNEPIVKQDGATKNDCEINAAKRLFDHLQSLYRKEYMVFVFDALYACAPIISRLLEVKRWEFVIGITPDGNKSLFQQFEGRDQRGQVHWHTQKEGKTTHRFGYTNDLALNESHGDIRVNMLYYEETNAKGVVKTFTWITSIKLTKANVYKVMRIGRGRWKIENEAFNTLKNQQYNFEHNFGHGQEHLCTNFAFLMMLAFYVDQIQQSSCKYFKKILQELKTRIKFWETIQAVFKITPCNNMKQVFFCIADMYQIRLE